MTSLCAAGSLATGLLILPASAASGPPTGQEELPPVRVEDRQAMDPEIAALIAQHVDIVEDDPANGQVHASLGLVYEANTLFTPAIACYRNALALLPGEAQWVYRLGVVLTAAGDPEALSTMERAAEVFRNTAVIQARLGQLRFMAGDLQGASAAWEQGIASEAIQPQLPPWPESRVGLAQVRMAEERWEEAVTLLEEALTMDPAYRHAHFLLGQCLVELELDEQGELELKRGVNAWPRLPGDPHQPRLDEYAVGYHRRMMGIENLLQSGRAAEAFDAVEAVLAQRPNNHFALNLKARAYAMQGKLVLAVDTLRRSVRENGDSVSTKLELATTLMNVLARNITQDQVLIQAMAEEIMKMTEEAVAMAPQLGRARFYRGLALRMAVDAQNPNPQAMNAVLREMSLALTLGCVERQLYEQLATLYASMGRKREMLEFARAHADVNADNPQAFIFLAKAFFTSNDPKSGLAAAERAARLAPNDPNVAQFLQMARKAATAAEQGPPQPPDKRQP